MEAPQKPAPLQLRFTDDGLELGGTVLWLDSFENGELSFISSANKFRRASVPRVISTEETMRLLEAKRKTRPNALVCQYNRPFSIGNLKIELLPSGEVLGGASLLVERNSEKILYAPHVQPHRTLTNRQMQLKKAHTLIVGAYLAETDKILPSRRKEKDRLIQEILDSVALSKAPVVVCRCNATAVEITKLLNDVGLYPAVNDSVHRILKVYESFGTKIGSYSLATQRTTKSKVLLFGLNEDRETLPSKNVSPDRPLFMVEDNFDDSNSPFIGRPINARFYLTTAAELKDLKEVIAAVHPKEVYLVGPYAKRFAEELQGSCKVVKPLYENQQPTLF